MCSINLFFLLSSLALHFMTFVLSLKIARCRSGLANLDNHKSFSKTEHECADMQP